MAGLEACAVLSAIGFIFLAGVGVLMFNEYEYIAVKGKRAGMTCFYAAGVYLVILIVIVTGKCRKKKTDYERDEDTGSESEDDDEPLIKVNRKKKV
jgi:hypothetical protein